MKDVSPKELNTLLHDEDTDEVLVDVRSAGEFQGVHIEGAINIPVDEIKETANRLKKYGSVYVTCGSGVRSQQACRELEAQGVPVVNLKGGLSAWQHEGLRVIGSNAQRLPIIRQVMIVAGALVLIGVALGWLIYPYWYGLAAFVGAGLLFAGVSGFCSMAYVLGKMPWNR